MKIQETIASGCQKIKEFATASAQYVVKIAGQATQAIKDLAMKIYDFVVPLFTSMKGWVGANKQLVMWSLGSAAVAVALYALITRMCSKQGPNPIHA